MVYSSSCIYPSLYSGGHQHQLLALLIILHSRLSFPLFWRQVVYPLVYHYHFYILHYSLTHFTQLAFIYSMLLIYSLYSTSIYISHLLALLIFTLSTTLYFYIYSTTPTFPITLHMTPFTFSFPFYSLFPILQLQHHPLSLYSLFYITLLIFITLLYFIHYSLYTILHYYTQPYYH